MRTRLTASVLGLALIAGCATPGYKAAEKTNNSLSDVKSELITDKSTLRTAVDDLNALVYSPGSDLRPQFEKYSSDVDALEKSAASSRKSARGMSTNREAYLAKWRADTSAIADTDLRMRAMDRIAETEKNFSILSDKLVDADNALAPVVNDLKALRDYIGNDLTANNIKLVSDRATSAKNRSISVNEKIDVAVTELDKVSDTIAPMPTTQPTS
ncbi:MAG: hypothetical protein JWM57_1724 [Phycisphaerales bacterium]|nr:hypothetical protein [Phycisphaerales bacterium]